MSKKIIFNTPSPNDPFNPEELIDQKFEKYNSDFEPKGVMRLVHKVMRVIITLLLVGLISLMGYGFYFVFSLLEKS